MVSSGSGQVFDEVDLSDEWCDYDDEGANSPPRPRCFHDAKPSANALGSSVTGGCQVQITELTYEIQPYHEKNNKGGGGKKKKR